MRWRRWHILLLRVTARSLPSAGVNGRLRQCPPPFPPFRRDSRGAPPQSPAGDHPRHDATANRGEAWPHGCRRWAQRRRSSLSQVRWVGEQPRREPAHSTPCRGEGPLCAAPASGDGGGRLPPTGHAAGPGRAAVGAAAVAHRRRRASPTLCRRPPGTPAGQLAAVEEWRPWRTGGGRRCPATAWLVDP